MTSARSPRSANRLTDVVRWHYLSYRQETPIGNIYHTIQLDSPDWFTWLARDDVRLFSYELPGDKHITVRKEKRQRGGSYWVAYTATGGKLRKRYLGLSETLSRAHLDTVARELLSLPAVVRVTSAKEGDK